MRRFFVHLATIASLAAASLLATVAFATGNPPGKAKTLHGEFVEAYNVCTAPNDTTSGGFSACNPAVPSDSTCGFDVKGSGTFQLQADAAHTDIKVKVKLQKLGAGCEGLQLFIVPTFRMTPEDCSGTQKCTTITLVDVGLARCTVAGGKCSISTTFNKQLGFQAFPTGRKTRISIDRVLMMNGSTPVFQDGIYLP
jgi:hypothetical protein